MSDARQIAADRHPHGREIAGYLRARNTERIGTDGKSSIAATLSEARNHVEQLAPGLALCKSAVNSEVAPLGQKTEPGAPANVS